MSYGGFEFTHHCISSALGNIYEQVSGDELIVARRGVIRHQQQQQQNDKLAGMAENSDKGFLV